MLFCYDSLKVRLPLSQSHESATERVTVKLRLNPSFSESGAQLTDLSDFFQVPISKSYLSVICYLFREIFTVSQFLIAVAQTRLILW